MARLGTLPAFLALGIAVLALGIVVPEAGAQPGEGLPLQLVDYNPDVIVDLVQGLQLDADYRSWYRSGAVEENASDHADSILPGSSIVSMSGNGGTRMYVVAPSGINQPFQVVATGGWLNTNKLSQLSELLLTPYTTSDCSGVFTRNGLAYTQLQQNGLQAASSGSGGSLTLTWEMGGLPAALSNVWCLNLILVEKGGEGILAVVNDL
jgi:hypothetical protein